MNPPPKSPPPPLIPTRTRTATHTLIPILIPLHPVLTLDLARAQLLADKILSLVVKGGQTHETGMVVPL